MKRTTIAVLFAAALAGCTTTPPPEPVQVTVQGPVFAKTRLDCGRRPVPPDPAAVKDVDAEAAFYEAELRYWGQRCQNKLLSIGRELEGAGQVTK